MILIEPILRAAATPLVVSRWPIYSLPFFRADSLAWGALIAAAEYDSSSWIVAHRAQARLGAIIAGILIGGFSGLHSFRLTANSIFFNAVGYSLIDLMFASIVVSLIGFSTGFIHRILTTSLLRYMGKISYTFYLYHLGLLLVVHRYIHSTGLSILVAFLATSAIAAASWHLIESPLLSSPRWDSERKRSNMSFHAVGTDH